MRLYHAVGNAAERCAGHTAEPQIDSHLVSARRAAQGRGRDVDLFYATDIPNRDVRYYQLQSDIVCDMLTIGWFGSNVREAMMLGKPAVCYLRLVWLEQIRRQVPDYIEELPVVSATPETVYDVVVRAARRPGGAAEIGERGREFAPRYSAKAGAQRFDEIYSELLETR